MLFNSYAFLFFYLPVVFGMFLWLGRRSPRAAALWLGLASLFFYGWWDYHFLGLLLGSIVFNFGAGYLIGKRVHEQKPAKAILVAALVGNLGLLAWYKYAGFFVDSFNAAFGWSASVGDILLPLGISFFTFTQIAFLVDTYRGKAREYDFIHYLLFVTYFPHLIAGPILHHAQMMPQFMRESTYRINWDNIAAGATIFTIGMAKKVLVADELATFATPVFAAADGGASVMFIEAWIGALAYTLQLYFDFSGYCDMAIGLSLLFNIRLPLNFDSPYKATSIIDFWRRWHMTLSTFLRDYLYIALGGNRYGTFRRYLNLMITMLLGGLWHGAGWTFVAWGGLHGAYLVLNHGFRNLRAQIGWEDGRFGRAEWLLAGTVTLLAVVVAWVFFRAETFDGALNLLAGMAGLNGLSVSAAWAIEHPQLMQWLPDGVLTQGFVPDGLMTERIRAPVRWIAVGLLAVWLLPNSQEIVRRAELAANLSPATGWRARLVWQGTPRQALVVGLLLAYALLNLVKPSEFLYFQF